MNDHEYQTQFSNSRYQVEIFDIEPVRLLHQCERCSGNVLMRLDDGSLKNLKTDVFLRTSLRTRRTPDKSITLMLTDRGDLKYFFSYLSGGWSDQRPYCSQSLYN